MSSHKKKKYESDSSSDSDSSNESSSSEDRSNKKKSHQKHSSDSDSEPKAKKKYVEPSGDSDTNRLRHRTSKRGDGKEIDNKLKRTDHDNKHRSNDGNSYKHKSEKRVREDEDEKHRKESRYRDRDNEEREKYNKDRRDDREYNRGKYNYRDRQDNRNRDRDRNREFDNNRREQNEDKYKKNDYRRKRSGSFDHANAKWGKPENETKVEKQDPKEKDKPNFGLSGKLTEETNTFRGFVIKYSEPPEARKPRRRWRLYPFKGEKALQTLYIHRESGYLIGRERKIVDLPVDHPSCSKQHAALQYRLVPFTRENGSAGKRVRPYLIDLESANGTFINNKKIEAKKYYELFERDVLKFGFSSREYVLLHENSKDEAMDDDVKIEEEEETEVKVKTEQ